MDSTPGRGNKIPKALLHDQKIKSPPLNLTKFCLSLSHWVSRDTSRVAASAGSAHLIVSLLLSHQCPPPHSFQSALGARKHGFKPRFLTSA